MWGEVVVVGEEEEGVGVGVSGRLGVEKPMTEVGVDDHELVS